MKILIDTTENEVKVEGGVVYPELERQIIMMLSMAFTKLRVADGPNEPVIIENG